MHAPLLAASHHTHLRNHLLFTHSTLSFSLTKSHRQFAVMANPPLDAPGLVRKWAHVSLVAEHNEERHVDRLAEALKMFVRAQAQQLVVGAKGVPILCSYPNDGTPLLVRKREVVTPGVGGNKLIREGGASHELLCQRAVFRSRDSTENGRQPS